MIGASDSTDYHYADGVAAWWDVALRSQAPSSEIEHAARTRLRALLADAGAHSPFYARRGAAAATPLAAIEPVRRRELMARFDEWITEPTIKRADVEAFVADPRAIGAPFRDRYAVWTSSGTSGEPGVFVHDAHALAVYDALELVRFRGLDTPLAFFTRASAPTRIALVAAGGGHFAGCASLARLQRLFPIVAAQARLFSILDPMAQIVARLNDFRPRVLAAYPTAALALAEEQARGRLIIALDEIWTGGETLCPADRNRITQVFGCRVRDNYGASEFMNIGWECGAGYMHYNADWVVLEPVDRSYAPVRIGEPSHTLLLTNLANRVQPIIRYDLGDRVRLVPGVCPCGSGFPRLQVEGRCDDVLVLRRHGEDELRLLPLAVATLFEEDADLYEFQLVQSSPHRLALRVPARQRDAAPKAIAALRGYLREQGVDHVTIALDRHAPRVEPRSGKLRRVLMTDHAREGERPA